MDSIDTDLLKLYLEKGTTYRDISSEKESLRSRQYEGSLNKRDYSTEDEEQGV